MITLALDTSYKYLTLCLFDEMGLLASYSQPCFKRQSETVFPLLEDLLKDCTLKLKDISRVIITEGPGSYTGLRIAMTIAKILGTQADIQVCTLNTMQIYGGTADSYNVILDARGHRVYAAHIEKGKTIWMGIVDVDDLPAFLNQWPAPLYGDAALAGLEEMESDFVQNFMDLADLAEVVDNVHALTPMYLKESDAYKV